MEVVSPLCWFCCFTPRNWRLAQQWDQQRPQVLLDLGASLSKLLWEADSLVLPLYPDSMTCSLIALPSSLLPLSQLRAPHCSPRALKMWLSHFLLLRTWTLLSQQPCLDCFRNSLTPNSPCSLLQRAVQLCKTSLHLTFADLAPTFLASLVLGSFSLVFPSSPPKDIPALTL